MLPVASMTVFIFTPLFVHFEETKLDPGYKFKIKPE